MFLIGFGRDHSNEMSSWDREELEKEYKNKGIQTLRKAN